MNPFHMDLFGHCPICGCAGHPGGYGHPFDPMTSQIPCVTTWDDVCPRCGRARSGSKQVYY